MTSQEDLDKHFRQVHENLLCKICDKKFYIVSNYKKHKVTNSQNFSTSLTEGTLIYNAYVLICFQIKYKFITEDYYAQHIKLQLFTIN